MKNKLFIGALGVLCCSCAGNSVLLDTESDLRGLNNEYELGKSKAIVGAELKAETFGDEDSIQMLKDNYIAEIMGRLEVAKEKVMRTAYSAASPRVGVFKVGSCGNYKYLAIVIDCENGRSKTRVEGNVGDSFVDGNDNMHLEFCLVEAANSFPGGVLLIEDAPTVNESFIIVRHHDTEDGGHQSLWSDDPFYRDGDISRISGLSKLDANATLAWHMNRNMSAWGGRPPMGPVGINYGVIALPDMSSGNLYLDDEDHNNKNWAQRWLGNRYQADLGNSGCYFGVEIGINTRYYICLNTDKDKFGRLVQMSSQH